MTKYTIDFDLCKEKGIPLSQLLYIMSVYFKQRITPETMQECLDKRYIYFSAKTTGRTIEDADITERGIDLVEDILTTSELKTTDYTDSKILELAKKMKELYPQGKKPETEFYWTEGPALIVRRLKLFFKKYGTNYSEQDILDATKAYVKTYEGNTRYMKLLKYFIFKERNSSGELEPSSDLLTYIENKNQSSNVENTDWMIRLK